MKTIAALCLSLAAISCTASVSDDIWEQSHESAPASVASGVQRMTAEEVIRAPGGIAMAHLKSSGECEAEAVATVRIADGVAPSAQIASLCADEQAGGSEVMLRTCMEGEPAIGAPAMSVVSDQVSNLGGGCYFCTGDTCLNNGAYKQRKEGTVNPCFPDVWNSCCWAVNGGCCY